jgi:GntR family transcriptional regulator, transcriptional repressor for pyruvate dehydrogenase complex
MTDEISITQGEASQSGYERVLGFVREQLLSGKLKAGDRLLAERELALRLGVSRPVIREVLRALAAMGVIEIRHGHGSVVRKPDFSEMGDLFTLMLAQNAEVVDDVMEACTRATATDVQRLEEAMRLIVATVSDPVKGADADFEFHNCIVEAAHSPTLSSVYAAISNLLKRSHMQRRQRISDVEGIDAYLVDHHKLVLAALVKGDIDRADRLLTEHFAIGSDFQRRALIAGIDSA